MTLLAEDLLLLVVDDATGAATLDGTRTDLVLGGALLLELALAGRVEVTRTGHWWAREVVTEPAAAAGPVGGGDGPEPDDAALDDAARDPVLEEALDLVRQKPRSPQDLVQRLGKGTRARLLRRLEERGILERHHEKVLGLFPRDRWPATDSRNEDLVRARLHDVLVVGTTPDARTGALVALLLAVDKAHTVLPGLDGPRRRAVKARAKEVSRGAWAAEAVRAAVQAMQAAVTAGIVAATTAATTGSS